MNNADKTDDKQIAIVLVGGSGKIGTMLAAHLVTQGHKVWILDRTPSKIKCEYNYAQVGSDYNIFPDRLINDPDGFTVCDLTIASDKSRDWDFESLGCNAHHGYSVLKNCRLVQETNTKRLTIRACYLMSSLSVFDVGFYTETCNTMPEHEVEFAKWSQVGYGHSKRAQELLYQYAGAAGWFPTGAIRISTPQDICEKDKARIANAKNQYLLTKEDFCAGTELILTQPEPPAGFTVYQLDSIQYGIVSTQNARALLHLHLFPSIFNHLADLFIRLAHIRMLFL